MHFRKIFEECIKILSKTWSNIPLVFEHCDLHLGNIIIRKIFPLNFKMVDWESCTRTGYPGVDFYNLINSFKISKHQREAMLKNYCKQIEIDYKLIKYLALGRLIQKRESWRTKNRLENTFEWKEREKLVSKRISEIILN